jgi:hypothetical protein
MKKVFTPDGEYLGRAIKIETTRTAENINGDFEKWKIVCDRKRDCMRLCVLI